MTTRSDTGTSGSGTRTRLFYDKLEEINNRCIGLSSSPTVEKLAMRDLMKLNGGDGCVLLLTDGRLNNSIPIHRPASGIYHGPTYLQRDDYWAEELYTQQTADKEIAHNSGKPRDNTNSTASGVSHDDYFIMQWQCTPSGFDTSLPPPTIQLIASHESNPALYHYGLNAISPEHFPTVILHDAAGLFHVSDLSFEG